MERLSPVIQRRRNGTKQERQAQRIDRQRDILEERRIVAERLREEKQKEEPDAEFTHEGNFRGDIDAISDAEAKGFPYIQDYKEGFEKAYGIAFDDALEIAPCLPVYMHRVLSIRASTRELKLWQESAMKERKEKINALIDEMVREYFEKREVDESTQEKFDEVELLYHRRNTPSTGP